MVIDAHVHLWNEAHTPQPWATPDTYAINRPFGPSDLKPLLERNGVDAVVLVQAACLDSDTDYLCAVAEQHHWVGAVTAWLALDDPARAAARLDELVHCPKVRGIRHLIHMEADPHWIARELVLESLALVERAGLVLELPVVYPRHFDDIPVVAELFPHLVLVVDHLGKPPLDDSRMDDWERKLHACAEIPNVYAKLSGLNTAIRRRNWTADDISRAAKIALHAFGADRLMCGSDWPIALLNGDYDRVWDATRLVVSSAAHEHEAALMGGTAARVYGITP